MMTCKMTPPEPDYTEPFEIGAPQPKNPSSICGSFPNLTILTHDGTIYKLKVKRKWLRIIEVFWVEVPGPIDNEENIN